MFEDLKNNLLQEKRILVDMRSIRFSMQTDLEQNAFYISSLNTLSTQLKLLNRATPELLSEWSPIKKIKDNLDEERERKSKIPKILKKIKKVVAPKSEDMTVRVPAPLPIVKSAASKPGINYIVLNKKDKALFLKSLKFSDVHLKSIAKQKKKKKSKDLEVAKTFGRLANKMFRGDI